MIVFWLLSQDAQMCGFWYALKLRACSLNANLPEHVQVKVFNKRTFSQDRGQSYEHIFIVNSCTYGNRETAILSFKMAAKT